MIRSLLETNPPPFGGKEFLITRDGLLELD